jgi:hypothetical protein
MPLFSALDPRNQGQQKDPTRRMLIAGIFADFKVASKYI